jgi:nitroreductase
MGVLPKAADHRQADYPIDPIFVNRWSPRAMSGEPVSMDELNTMLEAARWAPSSYNEQPWRFLYSRRGDAHWQTFFDLLAAPNQAWCKDAAVLMVIVASTKFARNGKPNIVHAYDAGSAWGSMALQGAKMGLVVHGMAGFNYSAAKAALNISDDFAVMAMAAIGRPGDPDRLPQDFKSVEMPTGRRPVSQSAFHGPMPR